MEYMELAKTYLECDEPNLALKCLIHAKEYQLCAQLYEKLGKVNVVSPLLYFSLSSLFLGTL